jgi:DNA-binding XRE family transcriptional regulator
MLLSSQDLGAALRAKRRAAGLTQADLAQRAGCRRQTIVAIEAGHSVQSDVLLAAVVALGQGLLLVDAGAGQVLSSIASEEGLEFVL